MDTVIAILNHKGHEVHTMAPSDTVLDAARLMNEQGIGGVPVTEGDTLVGIFTERDILRRVVAKRRDPAATTIAEVMTAPVTSCTVEAGIDECVAVMTDKRIRHMPVLDHSGALAGIITSGDVLAYQVREHEYTIEHLSKYIFDGR